jgi:hypothetical protein
MSYREPGKGSRRSLRIIVLLAAAACLDVPTAPDAPSLVRDIEPTKSITVSAAGTKFHFLPPLARQPAYTGESDETQKPKVIVCIPATSSDRECEKLIGVFTPDGGTGGERVTYSPTDEHYKVNWKTGICPGGPCDLDLSRVYRIRVLVGTVEIAATEVQFVKNASELRNASGEVTALVDRGSLPVRFRLEKGAVAVVKEGVPAIVGAEGGKIVGADGEVGLEIPAGAVSSTTSISIREVHDVPADFGAFGPVVDLGPDGTAFNASVELSLRFDPRKLPPGVLPEGLTVYTLLDGAWMPVPGAKASSLDNIVTVPINHFSVYAIYLSPNNVSGDDVAHETLVGLRSVLSGFVFSHTTVPVTRCFINEAGSTECTTHAESYSYPVPNMTVYWRSSSPAVYEFSGEKSTTDSTGRAASPIGTGRSPGFTEVVAEAGDAVSRPARMMVFGDLDLISPSDMVAGWRYQLQVLPRIPHAGAAAFTLFNPGNITIAESGTTDYVWEEGRQFILPAGTLGVRFNFSNSLVGEDTLRATGDFLRPATRTFRFTTGRLLLSGLPAEMTVGDSVAVTLSIADQNGQMTGELALPTSFSHTLSSGLSLSQGNLTTDITITSRTSEIYHLKAIAPGSHTIRIAHRNYEPLEAVVNVKPAILGAFDLVTGDIIHAAGWTYPLSVRRSGSLTDQVKALITSRNRLRVIDNQSGATVQPGFNMGYLLVPGAQEKLLSLVLDGPGEDTLIVEAPGYLPDTLVVRSAQSHLSLQGLPASMSVGDSASLTLSITDPSGNPPRMDMSSSQSLMISAPAGLAFYRGGQAVSSIDAREGATIQVKAVAGGVHTINISHRNYVTLTRQVTVSAPIIHPVPRDSRDLVFAMSAGATITKNVPISNEGSGTLRNLRIKGGFVANCHTGIQVTWITATFTEGVVPAIMHLTVAPPQGYPSGQHDFCYIIAADGAEDRLYGVRVQITAPVIDPDPQAGHQFVVTTSPGIGKTQSTIINNAGGGSLRNMKIKSGFVANCYNGQQVNWITASFTEGVVPVVMHLTVAPPPGYPFGEHDFCYTLSADGAADRSYGVRLRLEQAAPEFVTSKQMWDAVSEFPSAVPFQGVWSAGRVDSLGAPFIPFPHRNVGPGEIYLQDNATNFPFYIKSQYSVTVEGIPPGGAALHPSCETPARAVLRWTAPERGVYSTHASFLSGGGGTVSVHVLQNGNAGSPLFFRNKPGTQVVTYDGTMELQAGATLDFVVGAYDNCISDMTPVDIQIRRVWDISVDFPVAGVPSPWSSGQTATLGAAFFRNNVYGPGPGEIYWSGGTSFPYLIKNLSPLAHGIPTNYAALHPGCEKPDYAVLRWTAPQAGSYLVNGKFLAGHNGAVSTHVLRNGLASSPLLAVAVTYVDEALPPNTTLSLTAGETLDFVVGNAGNCNSDSTPLEVRIMRQ